MEQEDKDYSQDGVDEAIETRTLSEAVFDRQKVLSDLRKAINEAGTYFSARTNETLWKGAKYAEDELEDLLQEIDAVNGLMRGN
jgi:hypothetical protein